MRLGRRQRTIYPGASPAKAGPRCKGRCTDAQRPPTAVLRPGPAFAGEALKYGATTPKTEKGAGIAADPSVAATWRVARASPRGIARVARIVAARPISAAGGRHREFGLPVRDRIALRRSVPHAVDPRVRRGCPQRPCFRPHRRRTPPTPRRIVRIVRRLSDRHPIHPKMPGAFGTPPLAVGRARFRVAPGASAWPSAGPSTGFPRGRPAFLSDISC